MLSSLKKFRAGPSLAVLAALGSVTFSSMALAADAAASESGREDIVVTGRNLEYHTPDTAALKIDAPLRDIPQTIDVIPEQVIRDQRALSMQDALRNVAGIGMATGDGQRDQFVIRATSPMATFSSTGCAMMRSISVTCRTSSGSRF